MHSLAYIRRIFDVHEMHPGSECVSHWVRGKRDGVLGSLPNAYGPSPFSPREMPFRSTEIGPVSIRSKKESKQMQVCLLEKRL